MKLVNKKTGEIATLTLSTNGEDMIIMGNDMLAHITKLSELKDYEDAPEEPKSTIKDVWFNSTLANGHFVEIDFISDEEAEKAVEKLKAWKRLKDKGFRFKCCDDYHIDYELTGKCAWTDETEADLDLLFGGEE